VSSKGAVKKEQYVKILSKVLVKNAFAYNLPPTWMSSFTYRYTPFENGVASRIHCERTG